MGTGHRLHLWTARLFLASPLLISPSLSASGLVFIGASTWLFAAALLVALTRWLPLAIAAVAAFALVILCASWSPDTIAFTGVLFAGLAAGAGLSPAWTRIALLVISALSALLLLVKINNGVLLGALVPCALLAEPRTALRRGIACALVFGVVLVAAWTAAGQSLADFAGWLRTAVELVAGYSEAMAYRQSPRWEFLAFLGGLLAVGLGLLCGCDRARPARRLALAGVRGVAGLFFLKSAFVRDGIEHSRNAFSLVAVASLIIPWRRRWLPWGLALTAAAGALLVPLSGSPAHRLFDVRTRILGLGTHLATLTSAAKRDQLIESSRQRLRTAAGLPIELANAIENRRTHVDPHDVAIAWAYGSIWTPVPVFQSYAAYTPALDQLNAERLADPRGPDRILRRVDRAIDGRGALWETPEYSLALLCRYREIAAAGGWQVLERGPDRCGEERFAGMASATPGDSVAVPLPAASDRIVVARLDATPAPLERLRAAFFRPAAPLHAVAAGRRVRLVRANLGGPLLLRVPEVSGWHPRFGGGFGVDRFRIEGASRPIAVRFFEIPMVSLGSDVPSATR